MCIEPAHPCHIQLPFAFPKTWKFSTDILERDIDVAFMCEIWEKKENKNHQLQIETMLETDGLKYISTPRPRGGAGIIVNLGKFTVEKLNINIPTTWRLFGAS